MQVQKLGHSGLDVSALCLGTDLFGSKRDKGTCFRLLDYFREKGGNFIDTANMYCCWLPGFMNGGHSETVIGQWLKERGNRNSIVIESKLAFDFEGCPGGLTAAQIEQQCESSLRRLQTDRIDIYYSHRDDLDTVQEETMEAFHRLVRAGKVRALGASNLRSWRIAQANTIARQNRWTAYTVIQQRFTYARPWPNADFGPQIFINDDLKDFAQTSGVALMGYSVLLSGAYLKDSKDLPPQFAGPDADARFAVLHAVAAEAGAAVNQVILAWMRQSTPAILPIIAGSRIEQLAENIAALNMKLSDDQMQRLNTAGDPAVKQSWLQPT
jgi:aryl-alcohol dehydrogenase-like predicted oxidoreductase